MSRREQEIWEDRYSTGTYEPRTWTSEFLDRWLSVIPTGRALDIACGAGRNALALAEAGFQTEAFDISATAISMGAAEAERRGLDIDWQVTDLDSHQFGSSTYDLITCFRFRNQSLWPQLVRALAPDGWIVAEHHFRSTRDVAGPSDDDFRVEPGEFLSAFGSLRVVYYSETIEPSERDGEDYALQRIVACNGSPGF